MTYGLVLASAGLLGMTLVEPDTPFWVLAILFVMMGHGLGATIAPMTAAVMGSVGPQRAGLGSAMTNTSREVGGVLGIALLGTVLFDRLGAVLVPKLAELGLSAPQASAIAQSASHGFVSPDELAEVQGFAAAFREAYMSGFHLALLIAGLILLTAAVVANRFIPGRAHADEIHAAAAAAAAARERVPATAE